MPATVGAGPAATSRRLAPAPAPADSDKALPSASDPSSFDLSRPAPPVSRSSGPPGSSFIATAEAAACDGGRVTFGLLGPWAAAAALSSSDSGAGVAATGEGDPSTVTETALSFAT